MSNSVDREQKTLQKYKKIPLFILIIKTPCSSLTDPVGNVAVTQSPEKVNKTSPLVKLSCSASSGYIEEVKWMKDGQPLSSRDPYSLSDGNRILQITKPNNTLNGIYTCNMSNAVYNKLGSLNLTVSCK